MVLRPYQGEGEPVLILHEAVAMGGEGKEFYYGGGRTWVLQPNVDIFTEATFSEEKSNDSPA